MNVCIKNQTGKTIFLRIVLRPASKPGFVYDMIFELHSQKPKKTKETIAIQTILNGAARTNTVQEKRNTAKLSNQIDWKTGFTEENEKESVIYTFKNSN